jgi:hypothetical protein
MMVYRGIRYDVRRFDDGRWEWHVYFKNENAPRFGGLEESEDAAVRVSQESIDGWVESSN